jgi:hypothetical protein
MGLRLLRAAYGIEFLVALFATFEFWSQVGGQTHLDLMAWWWKFGLSLALAAAVVKLTAVSARQERLVSKATAFWALVVLLLLLTGGFVTYYYHQHEPRDEGDADPTLTAAHRPLPAGARIADEGDLRDSPWLHTKFVYTRIV